MDERKTRIRELEERKLADAGARDRLLEGLGESLLQKIGEEEPFNEKSGESPGAVLEDYRKLRKELADSAGIIRNLELETARLKKLEAAISVKEGEIAGFEREISGMESRIGKALLLAPGSDDVAGPLKQREKLLLVKIEEQEAKLEELEAKAGGVLGWLSIKAQKAVSKTVLSKDRAALERLYRETGEKYLSPGPGESPAPESSAGEAESFPSPEIAEAREKASGLKRLSASAGEELSGLRAERRKIADLFGAEGSPARRIQALERHIAHVNGEFPGVYRRFGAFAAGSGGRESFAAFLREEDGPLLEKAEFLQSRIAENELALDKIKASISIDGEKAEIEKMKKAIANHEEKIAAAEKAVSDLQNRIVESERRITELSAFISDSEK